MGDKKTYQKSASRRVSIALAALIALAVFFGLMYFITKELSQAPADADPAVHASLSPAQSTALPTPIPTLVRTPPAQRNSGLPAAVDGLFNFVAIDVGQGDGLLVVSPGGKVMMVDAGTPDSFAKIEAYLAACGIDYIDVLVATHPHADHIGSMRKVVEKYGIGEIYMPKVTHTSATYEKLLQAIKDKGKKINTAKARGTIPFDDGVTVAILAPNAEKYDDMNNYSVVLRLTYGGTAFILAGDAEALSEKEMRENFEGQLTADVLKVGHHGSSTSTSAKFLAAVNPRVAVISVAYDNSYNHPAPTTIERLRAQGCQVLRTDLLGTIRVTSDGQNIEVTTEKQ